VPLEADGAAQVALLVDARIDADLASSPVASESRIAAMLSMNVPPGEASYDAGRAGFKP